MIRGSEFLKGTWKQYLWIYAEKSFYSTRKSFLHTRIKLYLKHNHWSFSVKAGMLFPRAGGETLQKGVLLLENLSGFQGMWEQVITYFDGSQSKCTRREQLLCLSPVIPSHQSLLKALWKCFPFLKERERLTQTNRKWVSVLTLFGKYRFNTKTTLPISCLCLYAS